MIPQIAIFVLCLGAMFLTNDNRAGWRRWAPVLGLASEPFWFWTTWQHQQWGIFASAFFYTAAWARGFYYAWIKPV